MSHNLVRLIVFTLATILSNGPAIHAKSIWLKASSNEVTVISDAPRKALTEYVVNYSAFRQAFIKLFASPGHRPPPIVLLLFKDQAELREHLAHSKENITVFSTEIDQTALTALADSGVRPDDLATAFEFDTVWSLRRIGYVLPLWMAQGTGEVMATLRIKNGECIIDANRSPSDELWSHLRVLPWPHFFEYYQSAPEYNDPHGDGTYQAQAWALMAAVLFKEKTPREQFVRLAGMFPEKEGTQAASAMLGVPFDQFTAAIQRGLRQNTVVAIPFDEKRILADIKVSGAEECEVEVCRGEMLIANGRVAEGNRLIDDATVRSPLAVAPNEAMARRALRDKDQSAAARYYRLAIKAGSINVNAWLTSASEYLDPSSRISDPTTGGQKDPIAALAQIHRTMELAPGDTRTRIMLGQAYVAAENRGEEGIVELSGAITDDATGLQVRYYRGLLYDRLGRTAEAFADFDYVVRYPATPLLLRSDAENSRMPLLFAADQKTCAQMLGNQQFEQARSLLDQRIVETEKTPAEDAYRKMRAWVDETQLWTRAVTLYNAKDFASALDVAHKFVRDFPSSIRIRDANRMVTLVEAILKKKSVVN